jgi:hypothetical protein
MNTQSPTKNYDLEELEITQGPLSVDLIKLYHLRARFFRTSALSGTIWFLLIVVRQFYSVYPEFLQAALLLSIGATVIPLGIGIGTFLTEARLKRTELKRMKANW